MDTYGHCQAAHLMPSAPTLEAFQHADHLVEVHAQISWKFDMCWDVAGFWTKMFGKIVEIRVYSQ